MKSMTCRQTGGACDEVFEGETFEQIAQQSQKHGMKMVSEGDQPHIEAMNQMKQMMREPERMEQWMSSVKAEFENL